MGGPLELDACYTAMAVCGAEEKSQSRASGPDVQNFRVFGKPDKFCKQHGIGTQGESIRGNFKLYSVGKIFHSIHPVSCKIGLRSHAQADSVPKGLLFLDGADRALIGAGAAANADISVDDVLLVTLGNSLNRALIGAGAALDTSISNFESHDFTSNNLCFVTRYV